MCAQFSKFRAWDGGCGGCEYKKHDADADADADACADARTGAGAALVLCVNSVILSEIDKLHTSSLTKLLQTVLVAL